MKFVSCINHDFFQGFTINVFNPKIFLILPVVKVHCIFIYMCIIFTVHCFNIRDQMEGEGACEGREGYGTDLHYITLPYCLKCLYMYKK